MVSLLFVGVSLSARGGLNQEDYTKYPVEQREEGADAGSGSGSGSESNQRLHKREAGQSPGEGVFDRVAGTDLNGYAEGVLDQMRVRSVSLARNTASSVAGAALYFSSAWKQNITSTVFWVGEKATERSPSNERSAWDNLWMYHYGGYDTPDEGQRSPWYTPLSFHPHLDPFYVALPYCDLLNGKFRPEAASVIPWFETGYRGSGISVCKDRWVAIYAHGRIAFAQWEDVGPYETDNWAYVFGPDPAPRHGSGQNAGIDVSPAVRSYLGLAGVDKVNWRFVELSQVGPGPWNGWPLTGPSTDLSAAR